MSRVRRCGGTQKRRRGEVGRERLDVAVRAPSPSTDHKGREGFKTIADRLTQQGHRARGGRLFASFTTQRILNNEALMGTLACGKRRRKGNHPQEVVRVPGFFPAILSTEEWNQLQRRFAIRRAPGRGRTHSSSNLLSGIIRCGNRLGPMVGKTGELRGSRRYRNYYCSTAPSGARSGRTGRIDASVPPVGRPRVNSHLLTP